MKTLRWFMPLGMVAILFFLAFTILGKVTWPQYSYVHHYASTLLTNEAPNNYLMRTLMNGYTVCFFLFAFAALMYAFRYYHVFAKIGYTMLFIVAFMALLGYGTVPISMVFILSKNDILHLVITIAILCLTVFLLFFIAGGYLKQERLNTMGKITLASAIIFTLFNLWHVWAISTGQNILGLIEWLTFYSFHVFTFSMSWFYTFRYKDIIDVDKQLGIEK